MGKDSKSTRAIIEAIRGKCLDCCGGAYSRFALNAWGKFMPSRRRLMVAKLS